MAIESLVDHNKLKSSLLQIKLFRDRCVQHVNLHVVVEPRHDLIRRGFRSLVGVQNLLWNIRTDLCPLQQVYSHEVSLSEQCL